MKKRILISFILAVVTIFALASTTLAAGPTTVVVDWTGTGTVDGNVNTGDTNSQFQANGTTDVHFTATDQNDNPYGYNVDTNTAYITGTINGGGDIYFQTERLTSKTSMYGPAGQIVNAFVGSTGTGAIATGSGTNFAAMTNGTYGKPHTDGGYNFEANGASYQIYQTILAQNSIAWFESLGSGSSLINDMTTQASGASNTDLGWGAGCYTNANAVFTGSGSFEVYAAGPNSITTPISGASGTMVPGGWTANGPSSLNTVMTFANGGSVGNYSIKVR